MMPITLSVLSAALVVMVLWRVWRSASPRDFDLLAGPLVDGEEFSNCPGEFVDALFRREDWNFVSQLGSEPLKALFLAERKALAIAWVRATAAFARHIMREHLLISRRSRDMEISTEMRIYSQYVALRATCVILRVSIVLAGPVAVGTLSQRVYQMSENIRNAHAALAAANPIRKLQGI